MALDLSSLSMEEKRYLGDSIHRTYAGVRICDVPKDIPFWKEIVQGIMQINSPKTRLTALSNDESMNLPLGRVIESFLVDGWLKNEIAGSMTENEISRKILVLRTVLDSLMGSGSILDRRLSDYFGCTSLEEDFFQHGLDMEQLFAYLERLFLPRGVDTELTLDEQRSILEKLPIHSGTPLTEWKIINH